jgi:REP element-mobilizing transposase RayT
MYWERRLPHWIPEGSTVFVTWSLAGNRPAATSTNMPNPGKAFVLEDRRLDRTRSGPHLLSDPRIAAIFAEALRHGETVRGLYETHAWVVMPNHVHLVLTPKNKLSAIVGWLKAATANRANRLIGRTGFAFWNREYFDHWIRSARDFGRAVSYVERNPVTAGLAASPESGHGPAQQ